MSQPPRPPPDPRSSGKRAAKIIIAIVVVPIIVGALSLVLLVHYLGASGITRHWDNMFGDQHLKTAVALIELHKVRFGKYPQSLSEIRFTGGWDEGALICVRYYPAPDGSKYCIEVVRGWMGKPSLEYPPEFWQGTGYSRNLCPHSQ